MDIISRIRYLLFQKGSPVQETTQQREPEIGPLGMPGWYHHHGAKMRVERFNKENHLLIIAAGAARVRLTRVAWAIDEGWYVDWEIIQSQKEKMSGRVVLSSADLQAAF